MLARSNSTAKEKIFRRRKSLLTRIQLRTVVLGVTFAAVMACAPTELFAQAVPSFVQTTISVQTATSGQTTASGQSSTPPAQPPSQAPPPSSQWPTTPQASPAQGSTAPTRAPRQTPFPTSAAPTATPPAILWNP